MSKKLFLVLVLSLLQLGALGATRVAQSEVSVPTVRFDPEEIHVESLFSSFMVNVTLENVVDFGGWLFSVSWDSRIIQVSTGDPNGARDSASGSLYNIYEGPFMKTAGPTQLALNEVNNKDGEMSLGCIFKSWGHSVNGSGVLASINFTVLDFGFTRLHFFVDVLADSSNGPIVHATRDGAVSVFTVCVDDDNGLGPWDGSLSHPYQNITSALQRVGNDSIVFVRSGVYSENLVLDKVVGLIGEDRNTTVVDGGGVGDTITVTAGHVNVSRLTIRNGFLNPGISWGVQIFRCDHVTISGNIFSDNGFGIFVYYSDENTVTGNAVFNNYRGIVVTSSSHNYISDNVVYGNEAEGISVEMDADDNWIRNNEIYDNSLSCIKMASSRDNFVVQNRLARAGSESGLRLDSGQNNTIAGNQIVYNHLNGISMFDSDFNVIRDNEIAHNEQYGIAVQNSSSNTLYHNNFLDNVFQTTSESGSENAWDNGYPSGGNFWSDFTVSDSHSGPYQNISSSDGIADSPLVIDANNTDHYPLVAPSAMFSIVLNEMEYPVDFESSSIITDVFFNEIEKSLTFSTAGQDGTTGFCRVAIPKSLVKPAAEERFVTRIDNYLPLSLDMKEDADYTYIFMTYLQSVHTVSIKIITGEEVVVRLFPETITVEKNETFFVSVIIDNVRSDNNMVGVQFSLSWNASALNGVNMTETLFSSVTPLEEQDNIWIIRDTATADYAYYACTWYDLERAVAGGYAPVWGNRTVAVIELRALEVGSVVLHFDLVKVGSFVDVGSLQPGILIDTEGQSELNYYLVDCRINVKAMKGDTNEDGVIDLFDAISMAESYGDCVQNLNWNPDKDMNNDQVIDIFDMILLANRFGRTV